MKLSVLIIAHNEEDVIEKCLKSIKDAADEIIVVDSYSTDDTVKIAENFGAKVYQHHLKNFADQRNYAATLAKGEWILYLDADEEATPAFIKEVASIISQDPSPKTQEPKNGYFIRRKTFYYGIDWGLTDRVQRLFKSGEFKQWKGVVHETPYINGEFGEIKSPIIHKTHRDIYHMVAKTNEWSEYEADLRYKAGHPRMTPLRFIRVMATAFFRSYVNEKGYRNGTAGIVEGIYQAFSMFVTYAKLWETQNSSMKNSSS